MRQSGLFYFFAFLLYVLGFYAVIGLGILATGPYTGYIVHALLGLMILSQIAVLFKQPRLAYRVVSLILIAIALFYGLFSFAKY